MLLKGQASVALSTDSTIRRSHISPDRLINRPDGDLVVTVGDIFTYAVSLTVPLRRTNQLTNWANKYGDKTACYYRDVVAVVEETKTTQHDGKDVEKTWKYFTLSEPKPVTYTELVQQVNHIASAFIHIGFTDPFKPLASRPRVSIYADTSLRWQLMAQTFSRLGHVITTAYTTLGEEGLLRSLVEPDVELVFCGEDQVEMVSKVIEGAERVKWVIYDADESRVDQTAVEVIRQAVTAREGQLLSLPDLVKIGESNITAVDDMGPKPTEDDVYTIMYTSGSTGTPKGVLLTHKNMIASLAGSCALWRNGFYPKSDLLLAFLPLSHILEQFLELTFYLLGVPIGYGRVKTLLDDSVRNCAGDFTAFKPTLIAGVPGIYEMIRKGMMKKIADAPAIVGSIFHLAVSGKQVLPWPLSAVIDKVLFRRVKMATGGRLRLAVCGGGALSRETQLFMSTVLAPIIQGYGLTETCGMTSICTQDFAKHGTVGVLGPSTECKLQDVPDLGYVSSSDPPQGEIWLRGANIFKGYFKQDELTRETITEDGWYKTGDIGQWESDGTLSIIDRIKNLVKLQNGEYIALDKLESIYKACDVVMFICICAPPYADKPIALVYPHEGNFRNQLKAAGIPHESSPETWSKSETVREFILEQLLAVGKRNKLQRNETLKDIVLTPEEWSPDNGLLTAAMKLARPVIAKRFAKEIEKSYGRAL